MKRNQSVASTSSQAVASTSRSNGNKRAKVDMERKSCTICGVEYVTAYWHRHIISSAHKKALIDKESQLGENILNGISIRSSNEGALKDVFFSIPQAKNEDEKIKYGEAAKSISLFMDVFKNGIFLRIETALAQFNSIKVSISLSITLTKRDKEEGEVLFCSISLRTKSECIYATTNLNTWYAKLIRLLSAKYEECPLKGSNWSLAFVNDVELNISKFSPLSASTYLPLPPKIVKQKCVINVQNRDSRCFAYAIACKVLHQQKMRNLQRISQYTPEVFNNFDFTMISFPTSLPDITKFENGNDLSVNIYALDAENNNLVYPLRVSKNFKNEDRHWDLLYLMDENSGVAHYCYITDLSRLISSQKTKHNGKLFPCRRCLLHFYSREKLAEHDIACSKQMPLKIMMPIEDKNQSVLHFSNHRFQQYIPYVVYLDFECSLNPHDKITESQFPSTHPYTVKTHRHIPTSYCYYIVSKNPSDCNFYMPVLYRGENPVRHFWRNIKKEMAAISKIYNHIVQMKITAAERETLYAQKPGTCHICGAKYVNPSPDNLVVDHCHLSGVVRGLACHQCNIRYTLPDFVPIIIHNGSNYDFKLLISEMFSEDIDPEEEEEEEEEVEEDDGSEQYIADEAVDDGEEDEDETKTKKKKRNYTSDVTVIAKNCENFISFERRFTKRLKARFIDSYRFMSSALATLASNLSDDKMKHVAKFFPNEEEFKLVRRKGVFPYEYVTSLQSYEEKELPSIEKFYSSLTDECISQEDYSHAKKVYQQFRCTSLGEYSDIYLRIDVLLLADIFENFRELCFDLYKLDPSWHYSGPGLAWNAMMKTTNVQLELLSDYDMFLFFQQAIRGGYCGASCRYIKANNRYLENFDDSIESNYIMYLDANNLYGSAMSQPLPEKEFEWLTDEEIAELEVKNIDENGDIGYVLEVDIEYPKQLHSLHNDFPFLPEKLKTPNGPLTSGKLLTTLYDKKKYVIHHQYLKTAIKNGLILNKIHRGVKFQQRCWLEPYIRLNNNMRKDVKNSFEKNFYKLMNNCVYGKFLESIFHRRNFVLTNEMKRIQRYVNKPNFKHRVIINEKTNLTLLEMKRTKLLVNKFIQAGMVILDLSKDVMYRFHFEVFRQIIYPNEGEAEVAYTDTDSLIYNVKTSDIYHDLSIFKEYFDFSEYPTHHECFDEFNKRVLGKMKDETCSVPIKEFVALKAKLYCFKIENEEKKRAKGINTSVVRKTLNFQDFHESLINHKKYYRRLTNIRSYEQQIFTIKQNKLALNADDDKRFILNDGIRTLAWGHKDIDEELDVVRQLNAPQISNSSEESADYDLDDVDIYQRDHE